jgi:hypothetical protein
MFTDQSTPTPSGVQQRNNESRSKGFADLSEIRINARLDQLDRRTKEGLELLERRTTVQVDAMEARLRKQMREIHSDVKSQSRTSSDDLRSIQWLLMCVLVINLTVIVLLVAVKGS